MAAALSVSNCVQHSTCTISLTGDTASTTRIIQIVDPNGHTSNNTVITDGTGAATVKFVPQVAGKYTFNDVALMSTVVSITSNSSHL